MSTTGLPPAPPVAAEALRSVHTTNLPALFAQLQISLLVTTYQAGKVIVVRHDGGVLNTHFLSFAKPMGLVAARGRLSIGGARMVWEYRNVPAVAQKIAPIGKYDACYLPRSLHVTGDIDIHEMAYDAAERRAGLALGPGGRDDALVSNDATIPAAVAGRLGGGDVPGRGGAGALGGAMTPREIRVSNAREGE
jgi:Domain of unknown function (DUF4915)